MFSYTLFKKKSVIPSLFLNKIIYIIILSAPFMHLSLCW